MKKILVLTIITGVSIFVLFSCDLLSGSISASKRVEMFGDDVVAGNYSNLVSHISQDATTMDTAVIDADFWANTRFKVENGPTGITQDTEASFGGDVTITATLVTNVGDFPFTFELTPDITGNYYIYEIYDETDSTEVVKTPLTAE